MGYRVNKNLAMAFIDPAHAAIGTRLGVQFLGTVYAATMLIFVNDESEELADTRAFLARRIEGIMRFEKAKAKWTANDHLRFSPARFLGRLRYPSR